MKKNNVKNLFESKRGMTLVEVLVALTILMIIIFTFTPLFATYLKNIRNSGDATRRNYERASLMERLLANTGHNPTDVYETEVNSVPLTLSAGGNSLVFYDGSSSGIYLGKELGGQIVTTDASFSGSDTEYVSYHVGSVANSMVGFPKSLTDDFLETTVTVFPLGFDFETTGSGATLQLKQNKFKLYYTNSDEIGEDGNFKTYPLNQNEYYKIDTVPDPHNPNKAYAKFTFYGGNDTICFQNSPIVIVYDNLYRLNIEIGAPMIIMVGEKAEANIGSATDDYFYYVTHGVDVESGEMDIIAKKMKSRTDSAADLTSAMNCVEWVAPGMGTDENGNSNDYGYYVMGGDNGQIRRFWRHGTAGKPGNYYWGGDDVVDMTAYSTGTTSMESGRRTEVHESIMYQGATSTDNENMGSNLLLLFHLSKGTGNYNVYTANYGTANVTTDKYVYVDGNKRYDKRDGLFNVNHGILDTLDRKKLTKSYSDFTDYTGNVITITSVGSIPLITNNAKGAYKSDSPKLAVDFDNSAKFTFSGEAYPQSSYTLYCGTIPAYMDLITKHWHANTKGYMATLGVGYMDGAYGVTGLFYDQNTSVVTEKDTYSGWDLLNYKENVTEQSGKESLNGSNNTIDSGALLANFRQHMGITMSKQVSITMGYLSQPFASSLTAIPGRTGESSQFLSNSAWNHDFNVMSPREFLTFLDIVSFKLDIIKKDSNDVITVTPTSFSVAVGYALGMTASDIRGGNRLTNLFNTGLIYLRASGDGTGNNDTIANQLESGKGWSMQAESNIFHPFYGINQTAEGDYLKLGYGSSSGSALNKIKELTASYTSSKCSCYGWRNDYHKSDYIVAAFSSGLFGSDGTKYDPSVKNEYTHIMQATRCMSVDYGINPYGCPEFMVGTDNGSVLSWYYDNSIGNDSKSHNKVSRAMKKEIENYAWSQGSPNGALGGNYDYWTQIATEGKTTSVNSYSYKFISSLESVNDIKYGDDYWVVVGQQSKSDTYYDPASCGSGANAYNGTGNGSYINVRYNYSDDPDSLAWKGVKVSDSKITFLSVEYCEGVWYAMGFFDVNNDGVQSGANEEGVLFYATNPLERYTSGVYNGGWRRVKTRDADGDPIDTDTMVVLCDSDGEKSDLVLKGVNAMASQG